MAHEAGYFRTRAEAERVAASEAADETIRNIHLEMADAYERLASLRMEQLGLIGDLPSN